MRDEPSGRPGPRRRATTAPEPQPMDPAGALHDLLVLVQGTKIANLEVEWEGGSIRLQRDPSPGQAPATPLEAPPAPPDERVIVRSGYVGVFHRDAAQALPAIGDRVAAGAGIGEVETLRIRNAVVAPAEGVLLELLVEDRTPVEYGQPLAVIRVVSRES